MSEEKIPLLFRIQGRIMATTILATVQLVLGILSTIIGIIGFCIQNYNIAWALSGLLFCIFGCIFLLFPNYWTYTKIKNLFSDNNEIELIKLAQKRNINTIVALIALNDLKAKEFKSLFNMYLKSIKKIGNYDNVLLFLLQREVSLDDDTEGKMLE